MGSVVGVILAAGMGTRMRSHTVKVLHPLGGRPMLTYPIEALKEAGASRIIVVVGHQAQRVRETVTADVEYVLQEQQLGTGHAVRQTADLLAGFDGQVVVTYGDTPLYRASSFAGFIRTHQDEAAVASVMSTFVDDPHGYGRIVRDDQGDFESIVEQRDIRSDALDAIQEINTGTYCFAASQLFSALERVTNDNDQGEYYLPDVLAILKNEQKKIHVHVLEDSSEALGINDRRQLATAEDILRRRTLDRLMESGVTVIDPQTTYVHPTVNVGPDSTLFPFTALEGNTTVGQRAKVGPHARIVDSRLGDDVVVEASYVTGATLETGTVVGPFAHITAGSYIKKA